MKIVEFRIGFNTCGLWERLKVALQILMTRRYVAIIPLSQVEKILWDQHFLTVKYEGRVTR